MKEVLGGSSEGGCLEGDLERLDDVWSVEAVEAAR